MGWKFYNSTGQLLTAPASTATADTATVATTVTVSDNESTNENNVLTFVAGADADGGNVGLESDGNLYYNPSTGTLTATVLTGTVATATVGTTVTVTDNESTNENNLVAFIADAGDSTGAHGLEMDGNLTYNPSTGTLAATVLSGTVATAGTATVGTTVTVTDNESTNENNLITFVADAGDSTGAHGLEMDGTLHYNPSTGLVTATGFAGTLAGAVTGTVSGNAGTVTTNADLTGVVTSDGNATSIADKALALAKLADGTDGQLITWGTDGVITTVAVGTATHVLTSNGATTVPTFQAVTAGITGHGVVIIKDADQTVNNNSTLQNDSDLVWTLAANKNYRLWMHLIIDTHINADFKFTVTGPTDCEIHLTMERNYAAGGSYDWSGLNVLGTSTTMGTPTNNESNWYMYGTIMNASNVGSFQFQWAQDTAIVHATKMHDGSWGIMELLN